MCPRAPAQASSSPPSTSTGQSQLLLTQCHTTHTPRTHHAHVTHARTHKVVSFSAMKVVATTCSTRNAHDWKDLPWSIGLAQTARKRIFCRLQPLLPLYPSMSTLPHPGPKVRLLLQNRKDNAPQSSTSRGTPTTTRTVSSHPPTVPCNSSMTLLLRPLPLPLLLPLPLPLLVVSFQVTLI